MSEPCTVGLDVGSTYVKAVMVDAGGDEVATARRPTPWTGTGGYAEMTGAALLDTVTGVLADLAEEARHAARPGPVVAIGVSGMAEAGALLDAADRGPRTGDRLVRPPRRRGAAAPSRTTSTGTSPAAPGSRSSSWPPSPSCGTGSGPRTWT